MASHRPEARGRFNCSAARDVAAFRSSGLAGRAVKQQHARFLGARRVQANRPPVEGDAVARGEPRAQRRDLAVDLQPPFADPALHFAPRADARRRQQLLHALGGGDSRRSADSGLGATARRALAWRARPHQSASSAAPRATSPWARGCALRPPPAHPHRARRIGVLAAAAPRLLRRRRVRARPPRPPARAPGSVNCTRRSSSSLSWASVGRSSSFFKLK